jgi:hypothetical protein
VSLHPSFLLVEIGSPGFFLVRLTLSLNPPDLHFSSSYGYRRKPPYVTLNFFYNGLRVPITYLLQYITSIKRSHLLII